MEPHTLITNLIEIFECGMWTQGFLHLASVKHNGYAIDCYSRLVGDFFQYKGIFLPNLEALVRSMRFLKLRK